MQKIMTCHTENASMKSEVIGWSFYDGDAVEKANVKYPGKNVWTDFSQVGRINDSPYHEYYPATPLHALGAGWKILVPPTRNEDNTWEWWFVKD